MPKRNNKKGKLTTLLIVGEGPHDKAFLNYLKSLYDSRETGQKVTVNSADGGSPGDIIDTVIRKYRHTDFDKRYVLLDSDVPIRQQDRDKARRHKIQIVTSTPHCLEGMLLEVLDKRVPGNSKACKTEMQSILTGEPADPKAYAALFTRQVLDKTDKEQIVILRRVILNTEPSR